MEFGTDGTALPTYNQLLFEKTVSATEVIVTRTGYLNLFGQTDTQPWLWEMAEVDFLVAM